MRWFTASPAVIGVVLALGLASSARAAPAMFEASFILHAFGNDVDTGTVTPYLPYSNDWTALPLGHDCRAIALYTTNGGLDPNYCPRSIWRKGRPATGMWTASLDTGSPPPVLLPQSVLGVTASGVIVKTRSYDPRNFNPVIEYTYATFVNAAGSFLPGGGAAASLGYKNETGANTGTWQIRAGANAFGGAMGLLGKLGAKGRSNGPSLYSYVGLSSWNMVKALGRPLFNTLIGTGTMGTLLYQNPYTDTDMWYRTSVKGSFEWDTITGIGSGTLWTTGQVGAFAKTGAYHTSFWRTGYDTLTLGGARNIQLVTPGLTHWLDPRGTLHTAHIGILTLRVPESSRWLLLAAGLCFLILLRWVNRRG